MIDIDLSPERLHRFIKNRSDIPPVLLLADDKEAFTKKYSRGVPYHILVDINGEIISRGRSMPVQGIKELMGS